ncbi:MAG: hypothetical protein MJ247_02265 [Alphaproteobacteria bacterium]|nr:hypothetical protein [Alphaproteobacteria bacterium]
MRPEYKPKTLDEAYAYAEKSKPELDAFCENVIKEVPGVTYTAAPLKGRARAFEKLNHKYDGDPSRLQDLARGRIVCDTLEQIDAVTGILDKRADTVRKVDRMDEPNKDGYRDVKYVVAVSSGAPVEIQIHLRAYLEANEKAHLHYEKIRSIMAGAKDRALTPSEQIALNIHSQAQKYLYAEAARTYNATTKGRKLKNVPEETKQETKEEPKLLNNATKKALLLSKRAR